MYFDQVLIHRDENLQKVPVFRLISGHVRCLNVRTGVRWLQNPASWSLFNLRRHGCHGHSEFMQNGSTL